MDYKRGKKFDLSKLTDEQLLELMESVEDDVDGDNNDRLGDEDELDDSDFMADEIDPEDEQAISLCLQDMNDRTAFFRNFDLSLNVSSVDSIPIITSTEAVASTSTAASSSKALKRARSTPTFELSGPSVIPSSGGFSGTHVGEISKTSKDFMDILWRKTNMSLHVNEVAFRGNSRLPAHIKSMETPREIFCYFFTKEVVSMIAEETLRSSISENIQNTFKIDVEGVYKYIGVLLYMSLYRYPNLESYWGKNAFGPIQNAMTSKQFFMIKKYLCFRDESERVKKGQPGYDPLFRIRNLYDEMNKRFDSVPKMARLCVDEQMCSTKLKHHLRQYMPNKPHKWGIKLFVLCDSTGYAYRFEIYNGAGDNIILPGQPDLGSTANVVVRLSKTIPDFVNHIVFFDNFYTSLPLLVYLRARGIYSLGTIRANRIPKCKLPLDKDLNKQERGYSTEYVGSAYGVDINTVLWKDNKAVRLASTYVGIQPFIKNDFIENKPDKIARYDRKQKHHVEIDCPQIIREYNSHMGGVDLMDGLMGRYHIRAKTRNPMTRLFYHIVDMAATNAYILYRRSNLEKNCDLDNLPANRKQVLTLPEFRESIAAGLVTYKEKRVGRPNLSTAEQNKPAEATIGKRAVHPVTDIRFDLYDHFPIWLPKKGGKKQCKLCLSSETQCFCSKCQLNLCCSTNKNCFFDYHHK